MKCKAFTSLERALDILSLFDLDCTSLTARQIANHLNLPLSTTYKYIDVLSKRGFLARKAGSKNFCLGLMLFRLGNVFISGFDLIDVVIPHMKALLKESGETILLTAVEGQEAICLEKMEPQRLIKLSLDRGRTLPLHAGASSRILLAYQDDAFINTFINFFGDLEDFTFLALLPSYLEQGSSSLVYMADALIKQSNSDHSGFYLHNTTELIEKLDFLESTNQKTILLGVSYALLDLIEEKIFQLKNIIIMETGGMKGRRKEMIKEELHHLLKKGFGVSEIYSEYGMTELLSQAYSKGNGIFSCPPWMKVITRDTEDAQSYLIQKNGRINVIDLANLYSCSFIATQDLGKTHNNGSFEVLGRFDDSDIRGCNLMVY